MKLFHSTKPRVKAIAEEFLKRNLSFTWFGTMRADQGARMDDALFKLCKKSGLRESNDRRRSRFAGDDELDEERY